MTWKAWLRLCAAIVFTTCCMNILGCGRNSSVQGQPYTREEKKSFPEDELVKVRNMMDSGQELYSRALVAESQDEKSALSREAREKYYFPAQDKLDSLRSEYPNHALEIDKLYQDLNRRILDATKMDGM